MEYTDNDKVRTFNINDRTYTLSLRDPYGFCHITADFELDSRLTSMFTSFSEAERMIKIAENSRIVEKPTANKTKLTAKVV